MASCRAGSGKGGGRVVEDERPVVAGRGFARRVEAAGAAIVEGADRRHRPVARRIPGGADFRAGNDPAAQREGAPGIAVGEGIALAPAREPALVARAIDRQSVVWGQSVSVSVDLGGWRN